MKKILFLLMLPFLALSLISCNDDDNESSNDKNDKKNIIGVWKSKDYIKKYLEYPGDDGLREIDHIEMIVFNKNGYGIFYQIWGEDINKLEYYTEGKFKYLINDEDLTLILTYYDPVTVDQENYYTLSSNLLTLEDKFDDDIIFRYTLSSKSELKEILKGLKKFENKE